MIVVIAVAIHWTSCGGKNPGYMKLRKVKCFNSGNTYWFVRFLKEGILSALISIQHVVNA